MYKSRQIEEVLKKYNDTIEPIMKLGVNREDFVEMDFTKTNQELKNININDTEAFKAYIQSVLNNYKKLGIGGYGEDRIIYHQSSIFNGGKGKGVRTIHLGIDIWVPAGTIIYAPINSWVHSFRENNKFGDYGATIVLEHHLNDVTFYTLYGHLSRSSLNGLQEGMEILKGDDFASIGDSDENGQWPPHLHFQLISDMLGWKGDFYGVAPVTDKDYYMNLCPNPEKMLKFE